MVARTVHDWAAPTNFRITAGTGRTHPSFTVRAGTKRAAGPRSPGILTLYADSHRSGPAPEIQVNQMCGTPPMTPPRPRAADRRPARARDTAPGREDHLCRKRPEIPLTELTDGRAEKLLALIDRWIGKAQAHHG